MNTQATTTQLILDRIFHPSDFSQASEVAFAHALKLALIARAELRLMHVALDENDMHWSDFPGVRATLARWGLLPEGSARQAVEKLGLHVEKILATRADPVGSMLHYLDAHLDRSRGTHRTVLGSVLHYLDTHPTDLIVLATHQRAGVARWVHSVVAEPMARRAETMTLFIPEGVNGFIALDDGAVTLRRILIPVDTMHTRRSPSMRLWGLRACSAATRSPSPSCM